MEAYRKESNWKAICDGRDLLKEIDVLLHHNVDIIEDRIRKQIAEEILNPPDKYPDTKYYQGL